MIKVSISEKLASDGQKFDIGNLTSECQNFAKQKRASDVNSNIFLNIGQLYYKFQKIASDDSNIDTTKNEHRMATCSISNK